MKRSDNDSRSPSADHSKDLPADYQFSLPVEPAYRERPPRGDWEAGYRLSLEALFLVRERPQVFLERDRRMCDKEFSL